MEPATHGYNYIYIFLIEQLKTIFHGNSKLYNHAV